MKKPVALLIAYLLCAAVLERTSIVARALSSAASGLGWLSLLAFVLLRLAVLWGLPGWALWTVIERAIERRSRRASRASPNNGRGIDSSAR